MDKTHSSATHHLRTDYTDFVVVGAATVCGVGGLGGFAAGLFVGPGVAAKWASDSDRVRALGSRVRELDGGDGE